MDNNYELGFKESKDTNWMAMQANWIELLEAGLKKILSGICKKFGF